VEEEEWTGPQTFIKEELFPQVERVKETKWKIKIIINIFFHQRIPQKSTPKPKVDRGFHPLLPDLITHFYRF